MRHLIYAGEERSQLIGRLISKFCSQSLVDLTVHFGVKSMLNYIPKPINVENLNLMFENRAINRRPLGLRERFPALRRLYVDSFGKSGYGYFSYLIPRLEYFGLTGFDD